MIVWCDGVAVAFVGTFCRAWILWYDLKWALALKDHEWKLELNKETKNWFIRNVKK